MIYRIRITELESCPKVFQYTLETILTVSGNLWLEILSGLLKRWGLPHAYYIEPSIDATPAIWINSTSLDKWYAGKYLITGSSVNKILDL